MRDYLRGETDTQGCQNNMKQDIFVLCYLSFQIPIHITSGIDLAKLDMRSGLERLTYAIIIITVATMTAWIMALVMQIAAGGFSNIKFASPGTNSLPTGNKLLWSFPDSIYV